MGRKGFYDVQGNGKLISTLIIFSFLLHLFGLGNGLFIVKNFSRQLLGFVLFCS